MRAEGPAVLHECCSMHAICIYVYIYIYIQMFYFLIMYLYFLYIANIEICRPTTVVQVGAVDICTKIFPKITWNYNDLICRVQDFLSNRQIL